MKTTGIVRRIDELGRIVVPMEFRKTLEIGQRDAIEMYVDGNSIILKKHEEACVFCGETKKLVEYKGKHVCATCAKSLSK